MAEVIIGKWGDDLAIPIPCEIVEEIGLLDGEEVELTATANGFIISRSTESRLSKG